MNDYGRDDAGKDTGADGTFLPSLLAEEVVQRVRQDIDWSKYDLNGDGAIDRFMILHTTKGQEENPGLSNRIWSHYTSFEEPIDLGSGTTIGHYTMASLQTGTSGIGTIIHEMLHQMGAVDLYPVHDEVNSQSWKGPGDWDIMASGNWNGADDGRPCPSVRTSNSYGQSAWKRSNLIGPKRPHFLHRANRSLGWHHRRRCGSENSNR